MEVVQVRHINGGFGDTNYTTNSLIQRKVISMTKAIREEAITEVYIIMGPKNMCIAELGCSSFGPNTLFMAKEIVKSVDRLSRKLGHQSPEFQIYLPELGPEMGQYCLKSGRKATGTFYGRLFAAQSVHFVHCSYSLMWLSKVPEGMEMNKENINYMASTSPQNVINAYHKQFQRDFSTFLKCRSEEIVPGGKMVLTILGRKSDEDGCYIWELLALALQEMVSEGLIDEEKLHSFNIPQYTPSPKEIATEVEKQGSFAINRLVAWEITWTTALRNSRCTSNLSKAKENDYNDMAKCVRSLVEPFLVEHFGRSVIDELFDKYKNILSNRMSKEDTKFVNVTVSMTRKE